MTNSGANLQNMSRKPSDPKAHGIRCANYLDIAGRKATIDEYQAKNGGPDDVIHYDPSNFKVCMECDFGEPMIAQISQVLGIANHDLGVLVALDVKRMTGESIPRICFKERKPNEQV